MRVRGHEEEVFVDHKGGDIGGQLANTDQSKHSINIKNDHLKRSAVNT